MPVSVRTPRGLPLRAQHLRHLRCHALLACQRGKFSSSDCAANPGTASTRLWRCTTIEVLVLRLHQEDAAVDPAMAAQDHALVQRLDTAVVHWTRQVKAVVNGKDDGAREDDGALASA